jgi:mono/diheme cytochrome c family protein
MIQQIFRGGNVMSWPIKRYALALAVFACIGTGWFSRDVRAQQQRSVNQGVFTADQAKRGADVYKSRCASCHGDTLSGASGPPLVGNDFLEDWNKGPLSELFTKIRSTMPQNDPGKLSGEQTADIVAYILQAGKFPAGRAELRADVAALEQISFPAGNPDQPRTAATASSRTEFPPAGNLAQVMRGILFPSSNIIFTVQTHDPAEKRTTTDASTTDGGFNWMVWGGNLYSGWELVDYAAVALAESAPLMLTPGRKCENGKPVPVNDPDWIKFTKELADVGRAAYKASQSRNQEAVSDISNDVADACLHCHQVYRDRRGQGGLNLDPSNKASRCTK